MNDVVCVGYVHDRNVAYSWHSSIVDLLGHDMTHHQRVLRGGRIGVRYGTGGIIAARNEVAAKFVADGRGADWLMWFDTDMGFAPDTVDRLLYHAHPDKRPIVGGLCFAHHETGLDGMGGHSGHPVPTLYRWVKVSDDQEGFTSWVDYPRDQMVPVAGTGAACVLVHRSVYEKVAADAGGPHWYTPLINPTTGKQISEDLSFCARARQLDIPTHVHTGIKTTHLKAIWLSEADHDRLLAAQYAAQTLGDVADATPPVGPALPG